MLTHTCTQFACLGAQDDSFLYPYLNAQVAELLLQALPRLQLALRAARPLREDDTNLIAIMVQEPGGNHGVSAVAAASSKHKDFLATNLDGKRC